MIHCLFYAPSGLPLFFSVTIARHLQRRTKSTAAYAVWIHGWEARPLLWLPQRLQSVRDRAALSLLTADATLTSGF